MSDFSQSQAAKPARINNQERLARLRLIRSDNIGPITFRHLISKYQSAEKALEAIPDLAKKGGRKRPIKIYPKAQAEKELASAKAFGARFIIWGDDFYPTPLQQLEDAPPVLLAKGHVHLFDKPSIAIVGARNASAAGQKIARTMASSLGERDCIVTSGLARGIDTNAHVGALKTGTIAVLGTGLDIPYPRENSDLQLAVSEQGLLLSEHPMGTKPQASHFPRRNRIISGLSLGVLVVEAAPKSGSLITARLALEQGRQVFAIPGSPLDPRAQGCNSLIKQGAALVESADDVVDIITPILKSPLSEPDYLPFDFGDDRQDLSTNEKDQETLLASLSYHAVHLDELLRTTNLDAATAMAVILELELAGRLIRYPGNMICLSEDAETN